MQDLLQARGDQVVRELDSFHRGYRRAFDRLALFPDVKAYCATGAIHNKLVLNAEVAGILEAYTASDSSTRGAALLDRSGRVVIGTEAALIGTYRDGASRNRRTVRPRRDLCRGSRRAACTSWRARNTAGLRRS